MIEVSVINIDMESTITVLRKEELLMEHAPHSVQFQALTERLLSAFSTTAVIPVMTAQEIRFYSTLALLHDIGKQTIPLAILNKPGPLTAEEFDLMKSHTTQGCRILEEHPALRRCEAFSDICDVCRHHHERWDGSGYPDGLTSVGIAPWVQVVGLADAFDALVQPRVYKPAYPVEQARHLIVSGACGTFAPQMLSVFSSDISRLGTWPVLAASSHSTRT